MTNSKQNKINRMKMNRLLEIIIDNCTKILFKIWFLGRYQRSYDATISVGSDNKGI